MRRGSAGRDARLGYGAEPCSFVDVGAVRRPRPAPVQRGQRSAPGVRDPREHADRGSGLRAELKSGDASHFRKHWLGDWWAGKRVEEVLRAGYREAIRRAQEARKPIESLWVCA